VSTREQDLTGQVAELGAAGCAKVFSEKASGARGDRAELARVIKRLRPGATGASFGVPSADQSLSGDFRLDYRVF
jgi:DNA invertase Pin-like site-specific DNA recombinase